MISSSPRHEQNPLGAQALRGVRADAGTIGATGTRTWGHRSRTMRRAFRLATRGQVSEAAFEQEVGLIRTRQRWLAEQRERLKRQLADLERYSISPESVELLRARLAERLAGATPEDRRFVLEAVGRRSSPTRTGRGNWNSKFRATCPHPRRMLYKL